MVDFSEVSPEERELIILRSALQLVVAVLSEEQKDQLHKMAEGSKQMALETNSESVGAFTSDMFNDVIKLFREADVR